MDDKYLNGDPKLIWQDQIAGVINYDSENFIGALSDLQSDPQWQDAFGAIADKPGVSEFLQRLNTHFELCQSPFNEDGSVNAYQHPSRTNQVGNKDKEAVVALMKRYLETVATVEESENSEDEIAKKFREIKVVWADDLENVDTDPYSRDGSPAELSLYEAMGEIDDDEIDHNITIISHLREACYGLSASYELQRYLMQSFHKHKYDVDAIYELNWVHGCEIYFDETTCYVYDAVAFKEAKKKLED